MRDMGGDTPHPRTIAKADIAVKAATRRAMAELYFGMVK